MIKHSANLGYLWQELDLIEGIRAAKKAGFVAVECHWPFAYSSQTVLDVLTDTGLPMVGLNTDIGNREQGEFGICAHPDRIDEAHQVIDQAIEYAFQIKTPNVHVMAGKVGSDCDQALAMKAFKDNLIYASNKAEKYGIDILIEPINRIDVPDYFVGDMDVAVGILKDLNLSNLKIMYDCFHIQKVHGDLKEFVKTHLDSIGHIQIASFPDRHEPDEGIIDYADFFNFLENLGYNGYIGAEYKPRTNTNDGLAWLKKMNNMSSSSK